VTDFLGRVLRKKVDEELAPALMLARGA